MPNTVTEIKKTFRHVRDLGNHQLWLRGLTLDALVLSLSFFAPVIRSNSF